MTLLPWVALVPFKYQMQTNYSYHSSYTIHLQSAFFWLNFFNMDTNLFCSVVLTKFQKKLFEKICQISQLVLTCSQNCEGCYHILFYFHILFIGKLGSTALHDHHFSYITRMKILKVNSKKLIN